MNLNKEAIVEVIKSSARFLYFGALGLVGTLLASLLTNESLANAYVTVGNTKVSVGFLILAGITALIKLVDRYRYADPTNKSNGIAPTFLQK